MVGLQLSLKSSPPGLSSSGPSRVCLGAMQAAQAAQAALEQVDDIKWDWIVQVVDVPGKVKEVL